MSKLVSEQKPNDGGYHIKRLVNEANGRLGRIGKHGKRAKIVAKKTSLTLQFSFKDGNGNSQKNVGLGAIPMSAEGIGEAEKIAGLVTGQLVAGTFTWDWFNSLIGKDTSEKAQVLTCKEMVEEYKRYYFKQRKDDKVVESNWYQNHRILEQVISAIDKPLSLSLVREIIESTENNSPTRKKVLNGLVAFLKYFGNSDYKAVVKNYKASNKIKRKFRAVPNDNQILKVYETGFSPQTSCKRSLFHRYPQWQFLFSLLAVYGLRVHEAWNIANWDEPVTLKDGDWVTVDAGDNNEMPVECKASKLIVPAILSPNNKEHILCIKHDTKTGYRMAMPLSPEGHNWIQEFNLLQPLNLPEMKNPLQRVGKTKTGYPCTNSTCRWFSKKGYGFTPHDLRHAYNHRGHLQGYTSKVMADSLGQTVQVNTDIYLRDMSDKAMYEAIKDAINKDKEKRSELEIAREEIETLKAENKDLKSENELLRTKLQMYEAIEESKG